MTTLPVADDAAAGATSHQGAPPADCRNCGTPLRGPFCAQCGQRDEPLDPTLAGAFREMVQEATDVDGRLPTTLRALLIPGRLTNDWVAGRRARYFSPLKLYLTVSVVYFVLSALSPTQSRAVRTSDDGRAAGVRVGDASPSPTRADGATATVSTPRAREGERELPGFVRTGLQRVARDPEAFQRRVTEWAPRIFFVLVPLFAVFTALVYRDRRRRLPQHVWLALHLHAAAFLMAAAGELTEFTGWRPLQSAVGVAVMVGLPTYVVLTLRAVHGGTWAGTIARTLLLGALYIAGAFAASVTALAALLLLA